MEALSTCNEIKSQLKPSSSEKRMKNAQAGLYRAAMRFYIGIPRNCGKWPYLRVYIIEMPAESASKSKPRMSGRESHAKQISDIQKRFLGAKNFLA